MFTDCFTHLRSGEIATDPRVVKWQAFSPTGSNLGLTRMAEAWR